MKDGFVALVGRRNAGKSTLLNRLVQQKLAIVCDKPQTTRNRNVGVRQYDEGQVVYVDTPGVHKPLHRLNVRMVDAALDTLKEVDLVAVVVDATETRGGGARFLLDVVKRSKTPRILVLNKVDAVDKPASVPRPGEYEKEGFEEHAPVAALTGEDVDRREQVLLKHLAEGDPIYPEDHLTDQPERFFVAELVREQVLQQTRDELPFSTAVVVDKFEDPDPATPLKHGAKGLMRLYCTILVERDTQKHFNVIQIGLSIN